MSDEKEHNAYKLAAENLLKDMDPAAFLQDVCAVLDTFPPGVRDVFVQKLVQRYRTGGTFADVWNFPGRSGTKYGGPF